MTITGSLETFSLPELFQIIESGSKSGRLIFKPETESSFSNLNKIFKLWFDRGNFITIINPLKQQFITSKIINKGWINIKDLILSKLGCPENQGLGTYLQKTNVLSRSQINLLFKAQTYEAIKLFNVESAWFEFEEIDNSGKIPSDNETFPWEEITGQQKKATELSLEAMRYFSHWSRFAEDMPLNNNGLQRLINHCNLQFNSLEKYLCDMADGSNSLHKMAIKMGVSIEKIQTTALSMILAGMVEEVPLTASNVAQFSRNNYSQRLLRRPKGYRSAYTTTEPALTVGQHSQKSAFTEQTNTSVKVPANSKVSNSLLMSLSNFLKNNF